MSGMPAWLAAGSHHVWLPYTQMKTAVAPLPVVGAEGCELFLSDGTRLIDGVASWWTVAHGYNHPHIRDCIAAQLETLPHVMLGGLAHEQAYRLARRLAWLLPGDLDHVFFSDSGSVAVEVAMKMAIQYWINKGVRGRTRFVSFKGGYHGDTFATMSVCDPEEGMHRLFTGSLAEQFVIDLPVDEASTRAFESLLARHADDIAGVIVEPLVQGAGGMRLHDAATLTRIVTAARSVQVLTIFDEIFVGFGRTGRLFAMDRAGIHPDIVTLGKGLTGGFLPLAATVASARVFDAFFDDDPAKALMHGPTYMGNALACAAANASIDLFETEPRLEQVAAIEGRLTSALAPARDLSNVADVRVLGAIGAIELKRMPDRGRLADLFQQHGVFLRPFGSIVYTTPPLTIGEEALEKLTIAMIAAAAL
ncbi:MAG: adenosylmethionine--8-amino-7-oxononanoate transaminase [Alphaproteobacteria bacterium]|nr:adenosylmethionine--8-amino-7-oxononanoate transaminase [Alphaproteobacteria bacterium]